MLFSGSLRDNLTYGRAAAGEDEINDALELAFAAGCRPTAPGLDTWWARVVVVRRAATASGHRAGVIGATSVLLDEATSALDAQSEEYIASRLPAKGK